MIFTVLPSDSEFEFEFEFEQQFAEVTQTYFH